MPRLVSIGDTTELLGVSRSTVNRLMRSGALSTVAIGRRRLITAESIERIVRPESVN